MEKISWSNVLIKMLVVGSMAMIVVFIGVFFWSTVRQDQVDNACREACHETQPRGWEKTLLACHYLDNGFKTAEAVCRTDDNHAEIVKVERK